MNIRRLALLPLCLSLSVGCAEKDVDDDASSDGAADGGAETETDDTDDDEASDDADGDGHVDVAAGGDDCDDGDADVHPGADELCDGLDNDCDGVVDPDDAVDARTWHADADADGSPDATSTAVTCVQPDGFLPPPESEDRFDCDDGDADVNPDATEVCDADDVDEDCSGAADDADPGVDPGTQALAYTDGDGDGYGDVDATGVLYCDLPSAMVADQTDCDDAAVGVNPGATEVCDADDVDEDCSGAADDADAGVDTGSMTTWYADADADGYGDMVGAGIAACEALSGTVEDSSDCDDTSALSYPGATELCDGEMNDCDDTTWASDAGLASEYDASAGTWSDLSSTLGAGVTGAPVNHSVDDGDTLQVCEGTWYTSLTLSGSADLLGIGGVDAVLLDGGGVDQVVEATSSGSDVRIEGLTIQNGHNESSTAGLRARYLDSMELENVVIADCEGYYGGGAHFNDITSMDWTDVTFRGNAALGNHAGAAVVSDVAAFTATDVLFEDNETLAYAGALLTSGTTAATFDGLEMDGNVAGGSGGAWYIRGEGTYSVTDCVLSNNTTDWSGGAIDLEGAVTLEDCELSGNSARFGGAIRVTGSDGSLTTDGVDFDSNEASRDGGAVYFESTTTGSLTDSSFTNNVDDTGALDLESGASITVVNGDFSGNDPADVYSGGAYTQGAAASFTCDGDSCS
jgi:hypothetical protein